MENSKGPQFFNRHEVMSMETLNEISEIKRAIDDFRLVESDNDLGYESKFGWTFRNWFSGLYDGFDYTHQILNDEAYTLIASEAPELAERINDLLKVIATYPKFDTDVTQH